MKKIIRAATLGTSLETFCEGILHELKDGVIGEPLEVIAIASPDRDLEKISKREGIRVIGIPMERRISLIKDLRSLLSLIKVLMQEKPDVIHSMTPKAGLLCMFAAWLTRVPVRIHTFTGLVWPTAKGFSKTILMLTDKITCACATHIVPEGLGVLDDLSANITSKPMRVLGYGNVMGVDLNRYTKSKNVSLTAEILQKDIFSFVFVGRIVGDKGINELVQAFDLLLKKKNKCRLLLVGRFEDELDPVSAETRDMIEKIPEIEAVGPKYGDDLLAYYSIADCFVFPSYREGFPNTVLEAGAMEVASIVTDINGAREIITSVSEKGKEVKRDRGGGSMSQHLLPEERMSVRDNGVVIPSMDADALYDAMVWMMEHPEERQKMGKRAREIVSERWEQGFVRQQLYDFYHEVLK